MARRYPRFNGLSASSKSASICKQKTSSTGTTPERMLWAALAQSGLRFDKNSSILPGKPDLVFQPAKLAVFIDGDFWHGKGWRTRRLRLCKGHNGDYWVQKIQANMRRDRKVSKELAQAGWTALRFWESDVRKSLDKVVMRITANI